MGFDRSYAKSAPHRLFRPMWEIALRTPIHPMQYRHPCRRPKPILEGVLTLYSVIGQCLSHIPAPMYGLSNRTSHHLHIGRLSWCSSASWGTSAVYSGYYTGLRSSRSPLTIPGSLTQGSLSPYSFVQSRRASTAEMARDFRHQYFQHFDSRATSTLWET